VFCIDMPRAAMYSVLVFLMHGMLVFRCSILNAIISSLRVMCMQMSSCVCKLEQTNHKVLL
jgi:hypoxanthine-guanine phosphoribosyltransferase